MKTEAEKYRPNFLLPLITKVIEKSIHEQMQDYLQRNKMDCCTVTNKLLEQIIPQIHVLLS